MTACGQYNTPLAWSTSFLQSITPIRLSIHFHCSPFYDSLAQIHVDSCPFVSFHRSLFRLLSFLSCLELMTVNAVIPLMLCLGTCPICQRADRFKPLIVLTICCVFFFPVVHHSRRCYPGFQGADCSIDARSNPKTLLETFDPAVNGANWFSASGYTFGTQCGILFSGQSVTFNLVCSMKETDVLFASCMSLMKIREVYI